MMNTTNANKRKEQDRRILKNNVLQPFDVLCGRDKKSYNNIGNRRFRILISLNLPRYLRCESRSERSAMILSLTRELCTKMKEELSTCSTLRFFKRQKGRESLIELDFKGCREKIGHALRDAAAQQNSSKKSKEALSEHKQKDDENTPLPINYFEDVADNIRENLSDIFSTNESKVSNSSNSNCSRRLSMLLSQTILADASQEKISSMVSNFRDDINPIPIVETKTGSSFFTVLSDVASRLSFSDIEPLAV